MHCEQIQEKLIGYVDGDLRVTEHLCVEVHLSQCHSCRDTYEETRSVLGEAEAMLRHPAPENRLCELRLRIAELEAAPRFRPFFSKLKVREITRRVVVTAVLLLVAAVGVPWVYLADVNTPAAPFSENSPAPDSFWNSIVEHPRSIEERVDEPDNDRDDSERNAPESEGKGRDAAL